MIEAINIATGIVLGLTAICALWAAFLAVCLIKIGVEALLRILGYAE